MKHIKQLSVIVLILLFTVGCGPKKPALEMKEEITSWESPLDIEMIDSEKEGNFCIVGEGEGEPRIIPDKYYIETTAYAGTTYEIDQTYDTYRIEETDRYEIEIYDFHTLELIKTLDMMEIMGPYLEEWQIWSTGHWIGEYKGKYYLTQPLTKKQTETNNMEAISLILNDGERLGFDALESDSDGYYGGYGKNGKRHRITKEEYEQFQRDYEEYFNKEKKRRQEEE